MPRKSQKQLEQEAQSAEKKAKILKVFVDFVKKKKRNPTEAELQKLGITRNAVRYHFDTVRDMKEVAHETYPKVFENIIDEMVFSKKNYEKLQDTATQYNRFVVTTAVTGCLAHKKFYKSLKSYCEKNDALLLIIPVTDPASEAGWDLDPLLGKEYITMGDLALNSNVYVSDIKLSAKQIDPTTGLDRLGRDCSFIYGSPKQRMKVIPNEKHKYPHVSMSTGAITVPDYFSEIYMSQRTAHLADFDHKLGAVVVELDTENDYYYFRQIQAEPATGAFVDLGEYYKPNGTVGKMACDLIKLGDWHSGETDALAASAWEELCALLKPDYLVLEDLFNGKSISHHNAKKVLTRALLAQDSLTNLSDELEGTAKDVKKLVEWATKGLVVTYSNHDDFIFRWLEDGRWLKDPENFKIANELVSATLEGAMPCQYGVEKFLPEKVKTKVRWLREDESWKVNRIEQGVHGHVGPNGARGTLANLEKTYGAGNFAHSHTPGILRDAWQCGTSSVLDQGFNKGGSGWMHASIVQYSNGSRQMINAINGKWRRIDKKKK